jgi:hypothetical protein
LYVLLTILSTSSPCLSWIFPRSSNAASTYDFAPGIKAAYEVAVDRNHFKASFGSGALLESESAKVLNSFLADEAELTIDFAPEK